MRSFSSRMPLRRPSVATAALVLYGAGTITSYAAIGVFSWFPNPYYGAMAAALNAAIANLPLTALLPFIVRFPHEPESRSGKRRMHVADALFFVSAAAYLYQAVFEPVWFVSWTLFETLIAYAVPLVILAFGALAYRDATGEERRRIGWVMGGFVITTIAYTAFNVSDIYVVLTGGSTAFVISAVSQVCELALPLALAYAVLRHRVLDIGFVLNRTVVYAVMTTLVIAVVGFADWLASRLLSEQRLAVALEAVVTISFGFALNWIHGRTERVIDRIVFRQRHLAEKRIEHRIVALEFVTSSASVDDALAGDAPAILDLASAAVFGRLAVEAPFTLSASTGWEDRGCTTVDAGSLLVRSLRTLERAFFFDEVGLSDPLFPLGRTHPVLAIPILAQHDLTGFVLYGNHSDGSSPDPEEVALLARLTAAAGKAYGAVEARQWRERAAALEASLRGLSTPQLSG